MMLADLNVIPPEVDSSNDEVEELGNDKSIKTLSNSSSQMNCDTATTSYKNSNVNILHVNFTELNSKVLHLKEKCSNFVRKENSPKLRLSWNGSPFEATIDEGSELNCICSSIVSKVGLKYSPISLSAKAAGSHKMDLLGFIKGATKFKILDAKSECHILLQDLVSGGEGSWPVYANW